MSTSGNFLSNLLNGFISRLQKLLYSPYKKVNIGSIYLKYLKHLPPGKLHYHKLFGKKTWFSNPQEYLHGIKEIFIQEIYKQILPENAYVIDCGANIGLSIIYIKNLCPTAIITAFEPDQNNFKLLQINIQSHKLQNVELKNQAVWNNDTLLSFKSEGSMNSKINFTEKTDQFNMVQAISLKKYLNKKVDFLKIDIEGAEFEVIKNIKGNMSNIKNMFIEYHGSFEQNNELAELFEIIKSSGFYFYIKEAANVHNFPFMNNNKIKPYDIQLNIFCFRNN